MFVLHIFFRIVQAANNSLASAIGVPSPDSRLPDRKPETFSSRSALTLIESRPARSRLAKNSTDAPSKVLMGPATAAAELQINPPKTMAPCEIMITVAFMRPRAQLGIARCAATQSSEADSVHPTPASAATTSDFVQAIGDQID